jgi:hypothetical protein
MTDCPHDQVEPVELSTGEVVIARGSNTAPWRTFVGNWEDGDPDTVETTYDLTHPTWREAKAWMLTLLEKWTGDSCPDCAADARDLHEQLSAVTTPTTWEGQVEGDDYVMVPASS